MVQNNTVGNLTSKLARSTLTSPGTIRVDHRHSLAMATVRRTKAYLLFINASITRICSKTLFKAGVRLTLADFVSPVDWRLQV
jgi:hypothetical protein